MTIEHWSGSGMITYDPQVSNITGEFVDILAAIAAHRLGQLMYEAETERQQQLNEALFLLAQKELVVRTFCGGELGAVRFLYGLTDAGQKAFDEFIKPTL